MTKNDCQKRCLNHLRRIQGQLNKLEQYLQTTSDCDQVALLTTSIAKSFDTLRAATLNTYIQTELLPQNTSSAKITQLENLLKLYKK